MQRDLKKTCRRKERQFEMKTADKVNENSKEFCSYIYMHMEIFVFWFDHLVIAYADEVIAHTKTQQKYVASGDTGAADQRRRPSTSGVAGMAKLVLVRNKKVVRKHIAPLISANSQLEHSNERMCDILNSYFSFVSITEKPLSEILFASSITMSEILLTLVNVIKEKIKKIIEKLKVKA